MIVFTDDMGLRSWKLHQKVCSGVERLGVDIDKELNEHAFPHKATLVSSPASKTQIWVVPTDEEIVIVREVIAQI